jgi:ANTAR domain
MSVSDLNDLLDRVAASLSEPGDLEQTLKRITVAARDTVPGADYASISIRHPDGRLETVAPTDPLIYDVDALQYDLREGPCYEAVTDEDVAYSRDLAGGVRWPTYGPKAAALGLRSQLGLRLTHAGDSYTGLNIYARAEEALADPEVAKLFASHARVALGYADGFDTLKGAIATRQVIGEALGIVIERYGLSEERAFEFLIRASQNSNTKLRDIAAEIVRATVEEAPAAD